MCFCRPVTSRSGLTGLSVSIRSPCWRTQSSVLRRSEGCCSRAGLSFSLRMDFCIVELPLLRGCGSAQLQLLWFCARLHRFYSYMGRVSNPPLHGPMAAELFVIAHAAALAADAGDVGFLGNGFRGARLRETVVHGGQSGRVEARTGLRMMPTFPRPSLSFRTAGFPRYGWGGGQVGETLPPTAPA